MLVDTILSLLERRLLDIRERLDSNSWKNFVDELARCSEDLIPSMKPLDNWANKVSGLLSKYEYSKDLLAGALSEVLKTKGVSSEVLSVEECVPLAYEELEPVIQPGIPRGRIASEKSKEQELVKRIQEIVKKAINLK
jgi:hypothetical protein